MTKRDLLHHVWDSAFDGDPNVVEVYVRHLRRKVDEPFGRAATRVTFAAACRARGHRRHSHHLAACGRLLADGRGGWTPIAHQVASFARDHTQGQKR